ncbi:MAG: type II toxin-antitoxin system PemK/MazF family toxin [Bacteroidetes bacterium]|nr:type II toxin-antitoxin system PemK/MazF family toxin [Bacteroidota bacterium]
MKQCEIWYADLSPIEGSEQKGFRPVVIISGDLLNKYLQIVIVCPLTTSIKGYKGNVILDPDDQNGLSKKSEIMTFHIRSISKNRLIKKMGNITNDQLVQVKQGLEDILRY